MSHIFISYSHKDSKYVEKLEQKLIEEGFNVWIDHRINYGSKWTAEIETAINTCDAYIVVMSEDSKQSPWVEREMIYAERCKKPFFPLLLNGEVWFSLGNIQFVNVTNASLPPRDFYKRLRNPIPNPIPPPPPKPTPLPIPVPPTPTRKWQKPVSILAGVLAFFAILLALAYFFLPTLPSTPPFARSSELTGLFISGNSSTKFDKTVYSKDDEIYLSLYLTEDQAVGNYESKWYYLIPLFGKDKKFLISTQKDNKSTVSNSVIHGLKPPLLPGYYRVDVYKKGELIGLKYFWIE